MNRSATSAGILLLLLGTPLSSVAGWSTDPSQNNPVCLASGNQRQPGMAPDGRGGAFIVFRDTRDSASLGIDLYAQHLDAQGNPLWAINGVRVANMADHQLMAGPNPPSSVASDGAGGVYVSFVCGPSFQFGPFRAKLQHLDMQGSPLWGDSGIALTSQSAINARVLEDGAGGAFVSWSDDAIRVQHVGGDGTPQWTPNGVPVCTAFGAQGQSMVTDGSGGLVLTWIDFRPILNNNCDVYAQRIDAAGTPLWTPNGVPLTTALGQQLEPRLAGDGAGGAIVSWYDFDLKRAFARRVTGSGTAVWTNDGMRLTTHESDQSSPRIVSDGAGGAIIAWPDFRSGATNDYYAQRVDSSGARLWGGDALPLCAAPESQQGLTMIPDGAQGVMAVWSDLRQAGARNLYAQRLGADGAPLWPVDGVLVASAEPGGQDQPAIVASGTGAIVAFGDWRNSTTDVYAQQISADGTLGTSVIGVGPGAGAHEPIRLAAAPVPATHDVTIAFEARSRGGGSLSLFDLRGRRLRRLDAPADGPGVHRVIWDLRDGDGRRVASGVYLARLELDGEIRTARVVVAN